VSEVFVVVRASEKGVRKGREGIKGKNRTVEVKEGCPKGERRSKGKKRTVEVKEGVEFKRKKKGGEHKENSNLLTWVESWRVFV
jgi:hypothetical protein